MEYIENECGRNESKIVLGCMRIADMNERDLDALIRNALENGINTFDLADIYGGGKSEILFGEILRTNLSLRDQMVVQSKCGIREGRYDFSKEYILSSVDGILQRLHTDHLDHLLLHRPDALMEPEEVAEAFRILHESGKVLEFGVSNMNSMQIGLLSSALKFPITSDQRQVSCAHTPMIDSGFHVNMVDDAACMRTGSIMEYCRIKKVTIQSWSSLQYGFFDGTFLGSPKYQRLNEVLQEIGDHYGISAGAVAIAWILRIPGRMQAVIGTTKSSRVKELAKAGDIRLTREEWYKIYLSAGNILP